MNRTPRHQTERSRRSITGVTLVVSMAMITAIATAYASGRALTFANPSGVVGTVGLNEADAANPFFRELGTNGRTCATCHLPAQGWSIAPEELLDRFERTKGLDPIFRTNDGSNCEAADISTIQARRRAFSLLLRKGLIRIALNAPERAEFDLIEAADPYRCGAPLT